MCFRFLFRLQSFHYACVRVRVYMCVRKRVFVFVRVCVGECVFVHVCVRVCVSLLKSVKPV